MPSARDSHGVFVGDEVIDGRYRVTERLGAGSMGVVYRAEDVFLGRTVAVKVVDPAHDGDEATVERFLREARALAQIRHGNVVQVYAFGPHGGSYYFAMEYVAGRNLDDILEEHAARDEKLDLGTAMPIIRQIAHGLGAVHERGLVHRDVKPGNVVLEAETGRPVLVDFGLARARVTDAKSSVLAGTPSYMAPEQALDPTGASVTYRSDIYAFACTVFEMLTGRPVFDFAEVTDILLAHMHETPPPPSSIDAELAPFDAAIARALAKDPEARHESCAAFLADLEAAARKLERTFRYSLTPKSRKSIARTLRTIVLSEDAVARAIERQLDKLVRDLGRLSICDRAASWSELFISCHAEDVRIAIVDEELIGADIEVLRDLGRVPRKNPLEVVVVARDFSTARVRLAPFGVREVLPKPINVHVLGSVLGRVVDRCSLPPPSLG